MSDKDKDLDLGSLDWDAALSEWEEKTFLPETAKDRETQQPGTLQGTPAPPTIGSLPPPSKPLYVPPRAPPPGAGGPTPPAPAPPPLAKATPPSGVYLDSEEEEESNATVVAAIPRELLRRESGAPSRSGGGLGQMFAKIDRTASEGGGERVSRPPEAPSVELSSAPEDVSVVTSAKEMGALRSRKDASAPPPRPPRAAPDPTEAIPEGAMFDPFAEPDPFARSAPPPRAPALDLGDDDGGAVVSSVVEEDADDALDALLETTEEASRDDEDPEDFDEPGPAGPSLHQPARRVFDADTETSAHVRGAIHAPSTREYDPNEETSILSKAAVRAKLAQGLGDEAEEATSLRPRRDAQPAPTTLSWPNERPAPNVLDEAKRAAFAARAEWIESEARTMDDRAARARALLVASELRAIIGDAENAEMLAREAAATAPTLAMASRQARALTFIGQPEADASGAYRPREPATIAEALDAEARQSSTQAAMLHDALLAADVLRVAGDVEGAAKRWDRAIRIAPSDPRAPIGRAADRVARDDLRHPSLRLPDAPELSAVAEAFARALKIRGIERPDVATDTPLPNDALRRTREALASGALDLAAAAMIDLARLPELRDAASWLAATLGAVTPTGRPESVDSLRVVASTPGGRRALAARAVELGNAELLDEALNGAPEDAFTASDRAVLRTLLGNAARDEDLDALIASTELAPLGAALAAHGSSERRAFRVAGIARSRDLVRLARLLASNAPLEDLEAALEAFAGEHDGETRAVALEAAARAGNAGELSDALLAWTGGEHDDEARDRSLAAALIAERAGDTARAAAAYTSAFALDSTSEAALRATSELAPDKDLAGMLRTLAEGRHEGPGAAIAWLESIARASELDDATRGAMLEAAHVAYPSIGIASFLAERTARRAGDVEGVLRWIRERRATGERDPVETALDAVREALLVVESQPEIAVARLTEAHRARPMDVALRDLFERVTAPDGANRAAWRERRAADTQAPATRARLLLQAAHERERIGDLAAARQDAEAASNITGDGLARLALERAEAATGAASRLAESLLNLASSTTDPRERRESYERLADLDAHGRQDAGSALLWHQTILQDAPTYLPSLRHVENALLTGGRVDELEPVAANIARALAAASGGAEATAHAQLAAQLRIRGPLGDWDAARSMVDLGVSAPEPTLWALRALAAHARSTDDPSALLRACTALAERTTRAPEIAALFTRAGEAALQLEELDRARTLLERGATEDPGDVVTWVLLLELRRRMDDARGAAEACENLARASSVEEHRLLAWYDAGRAWADQVGDADRAIGALEEAARIDVGYSDVFARLSAAYAQRGARHELAALLERRLASATDDEDRVRLEVERAKALAEVGEIDEARKALEAALALRPDHVVALGAFADLSASSKSWEAAEQAWVRLARLLPDPLDQRDVYARLGELYSEHAVNLPRAEVALKEVLKRAPEDVASLERLLSVYKRQNDGPHALETAQQILKLAASPEQRRDQLLAIASIHETVTRELRKAEQVLEGARRELPHDVTVLRELIEFYQRQRQLPAVNILLDRVSADARRSLASGRFAPALFTMLETVFELRGKKDAARVVAASVAALRGEPAKVPPAGGRAGDPRLDDLLAPDALGSAFRALLVRAGDALDGAAALDLRALHAVPLAPGAAQSRVAALASSLGIPPVQVLVSPQIGRVCVPSASNPPSIVLGEALVPLANEPAASFAITRALKLVQAHASSLVRTPPADLVVLVAAWLQALNPSWAPQGIGKDALTQASRRITAAMPRNVDPEAATIALEVAATLGPHLTQLGTATIAWADRVALLALGDANAALDAIAWSLGETDGAPRSPEGRAQWVLETPEVRDLLVFSTSDAFANARQRAGITA